MANDPRHYVTGQQIQDLWVGGFAIVRRTDLGTDPNVKNWAQAANELGFTGDVTVARETSAGKEPVDFREIGSSSGPVVSQTNIPAGMLDHLPAILKERDRLIAAERQKAGQQGYNFGGPAFKQTCTETAIATIRAREHAKLLEGTSDAKKDNDGTAD